jgi:hypothetical protein
MLLLFLYVVSGNGQELLATARECALSNFVVFVCQRNLLLHSSRLSSPSLTHLCVCKTTEHFHSTAAALLYSKARMKALPTIAS